MSISLYDHQKAAIKKMKNGSVLCGGVGTGKSRTAIGYFFFRECRGCVPVDGRGEYIPMRDPKNLYIITPAKKRDTLDWERECSFFPLSGIEIVVDSWNNIGKYVKVENAFFIFDEQKVSGSGAWVKAFLKIVKKNRWILLSATPGDTWSDYIPVFVANGFYKNRTEFSTRHIIFDPRCMKYPKIKGYLDEELLLKHKNEIVIEMHYDKPATMHHDFVDVGYDKKLYFDTVKSRWNPYKDEPFKNVSQYGYALRRIVNSSQERIDAAKEQILKHPKIIIFYTFNYELTILQQIGEELGIQTAQLNGHVHEEVPTGDKWMYLVHYTSGAEAWECITTDTIMLYSLSYSYKATVQAEGRIDRLNTPFLDLHCIRLISNSPLDKRINECLENKENFNEKKYLSEYDS